MYQPFLMENTSVWHNKHVCPIITGPSLVYIQTHGRSEKLTVISNIATCMYTWQPLTHSGHNNSSLNEEAGHCWRTSEVRSMHVGQRSWTAILNVSLGKLPCCWWHSTTQTKHEYECRGGTYDGVTWHAAGTRHAAGTTAMWYHTEVLVDGLYIATAKADNETTTGEVLGDVRRLCTPLEHKSMYKKLKLSTLSSNQCSLKIDYVFPILVAKLRQTSGNSVAALWWRSAEV